MCAVEFIFYLLLDFFCHELKVGRPALFRLNSFLLRGDLSLAPTVRARPEFPPLWVRWAWTPAPCMREGVWVVHAFCMMLVRFELSLGEAALPAFTVSRA